MKIKCEKNNDFVLASTTILYYNYSFQMSNFKILKLNTPNAQDDKDISLPINPQVILPKQISLMNYSVEQLRDIIQSFFSESPFDRLSVVKALKIVSCSLNDSKLISSI